jgi:hypothetical protein
LRGAHGAGRKRDPVDLVFEYSSQVAVLLWRAPHMAIGPERECAELLNGGVRGVDGVPNWECARVVDAHVAAQAVQDTGGFEGH